MHRRITSLSKTDFWEWLKVESTLEERSFSIYKTTIDDNVAIAVSQV